jgi:hypothetical protein
MSKVVVFTNLTLDGVIQAPGRPDEDHRGGFEHGGWATPYAAMAQAGGKPSQYRCPAAGSTDLRGLLRRLAQAEGRPHLGAARQYAEVRCVKHAL